MYKPPDSTAAIWGVFLGILLAAIYGMQLHVMQRQLNAMQDDQRPWVGVKGVGQVGVPQPDIQYSIALDVGNFGKTPAFLKDTVIEMRPLAGDFPDTIDFSSPMPDSAKNNRDPLFPGDVGITKVATITMNAEEIKKQLGPHPEHRLYVFGQIHYTTATDTTMHTTRFCFFVGTLGMTVVNGQFMANMTLYDCPSRYAYAD
jgi:hypothetical protein